MVDDAKVVRDLRQASVKYLDSAKGDVINALRVYKELKSDVEHNFQYPDMKRRPAFKLIGTIPINYRGNTYNIPVSIYLWDTHPYYAPLCYVTPTPTMTIKESENVNKQGRIYLPYLNEWRFPGYDLYGLIQMMVMVFQEKCPVFAKGTERSTSTSSNVSMPTPQFVPPAMPTPYPLDNPAPYPVHGHSNSPYPAAAIPTPPYPAAFGSGYNQPQPGRVAPPIPPPPTSTADPIRASLVSAIEEKLKSRLRDKLGTTYAEMASMRQTQQELKAGQQKVKLAVESLDKQQRELENFVFIYQEKKAELEGILRECGEGGSAPSVDEAIDVTSPLHRQLLHAYSGDLACDDTYYVLGQALKKGTIPVSEYMKEIRDVSRRQFVYKATMRKCREKAGLPV